VIEHVGDEVTASEAERQLHSIQGCLERLARASKDRTAVDSAVGDDNLAGRDALIYEER
jgi:hypothetical protein